MIARWLLAAAVGGLLSVERKAFLQAGLSRPLVASALVGACLGDLPAGLLVGAPLELLFLGSANLGAALTDHETLAACAVAAASAQAAQALGGLSLAASSLALVGLLPLALLGRRLDAAENRVHQRFADRALGLVEQGEYRAALRMNWRSLWFPFVTGAAATAVGAAVGAALGGVVPAFSAHVHAALSSAFLFASAACAAAAVRGTRHPRSALLAVVSAVVTLGAVIWTR